MNLSEINNLEETISNNDFHNLLSKIILNKSNLTKSKLITYLDILGEKFSKFYDYNEITVNEKLELSSILIELTDLNQLKLTEELIGILFQFRLDTYYIYLKNNLQNIELNPVIREVKDALIEYEVNYKSVN